MTPSDPGLPFPKERLAEEPLGGRRLAALFCVGMLLATLAPVAQNWLPAPRDGFPFSYYPMFSRRVGETYRVTHVVGIDGDRREHVVPFRVLGSGGLNEVRLYVDRAARKDPRGFCAQVAARLSADPSPELRGIRKLVVRTGEYGLEPFYAGRIEPRSKRERARCRVER